MTTSLERVVVPVDIGSQIDFSAVMQMLTEKTTQLAEAVVQLQTQDSICQKLDHADEKAHRERVAALQGLIHDLTDEVAFLKSSIAEIIQMTRQIGARVAPRQPHLQMPFGTAIVGICAGMLKEERSEH